MTDPRWTIDDAEWRRLLVFDEPGFGEVVAVIMARRSGGIITAPIAYDALVAAVHDADTLRQARQIAQSIRLRFPGDSDWEECIDDLLDLLSPPVPDTPTPTGQT